MKMGNRAIVLFTSNTEGDISPAVYLHWHGSNVKAWLRDAALTMRIGSTDYASARFCGYCASKIEGGLSLGLFAPPANLLPETLKSFSHGDAGVFVVNVDTGIVSNHFGMACEGGGGRPFKIALGRF